MWKVKIAKAKRLKLDLVRIFEILIFDHHWRACAMTPVTSGSYGTPLQSFWRENLMFGAFGEDKMALVTSCHQRDFCSQIPTYFTLLTTG
jgi:hypothetical protein